MDDDRAWYPTDKALFATLPGGQAVIDWFGFCPSFHDATLDGVAIAAGNASLTLRAFRMTDQTDERGYFILDRHAQVVIHLRRVTGLRLTGDAGSIISELTIRRLPVTPSRSEWLTCNGPVQGDIEVAFGTSIGLYGSCYAKEAEFELLPANQSA
ncbi:immunity 50 family protein [Methylobacterium sp. SyP6R]|uniref:immunity 50 family protein n=1 Tax=Methylobacterium sp. SyP6R TaxID=2718876 RepID=UPI001F1E87E0|nr:immunity 50 family protein [Methylobacterium sp. SyP6R]MCF4127880.1 immunity 50 family protein [Methylobacterium sp. SyP6R]